MIRRDWPTWRRIVSLGSMICWTHLSNFLLGLRGSSFGSCWSSSTPSGATARRRLRILCRHRLHHALYFCRVFFRLLRGLVGWRFGPGLICEPVGSRAEDSRRGHG